MRREGVSVRRMGLAPRFKARRAAAFNRVLRIGVPSSAKLTRTFVECGVPQRREEEAVVDVQSLLVVAFRPRDNSVQRWVAGVSAGPNAQ